MSNDETTRMGRRAWVGRSLVVLAAVPVLGACGGGGLTCEPGTLSAAESTMRTTLHYTDHTGARLRQCSGCALYTGTETACGTCSVIAGAVHPQGSCDSFVARA